MAITLTNKPQVLSTGSLATVYTCSSSRGAIVRSIQVANTHATATQTIQVTLNQTSTDYSLVKNLTLPAGAAASVLTDIIIMKNGDIIKGFISSGNASSVDCLVSVEEYS